MCIMKEHKYRNLKASLNDRKAYKFDLRRRQLKTTT
jgi:hypothetical protein